MEVSSGLCDLWSQLANVATCVYNTYLGIYIVKLLDSVSENPCAHCTFGKQAVTVLQMQLHQTDSYRLKVGHVLYTKSVTKLISSC